MGTFASRSVAIGGSALVLALEDVRAQLEAGATLPLSASTRFELPGPAFSHGAYVAVVEIERETGEVRIRSIAAADDCGRVVNPLLAEGQVVGLVTTSTASHLPSISTTTTYRRRSPFRRS